MKILNDDATIDELEDFMLYHMDNADMRESKVNPNITKQDMWDINMGAIISGDIARVRNLIIKNIIREFGRSYGGGEQ